MRHRLWRLFSRNDPQPAGRRGRETTRASRADATDRGLVAEVDRATPRDIPRKLIEAPNTYIFRLAPIRTKLGDRWEQFAPSVHRIASRTIFRSIDGRGSFERFDDTYVISFDRLKGKRARVEGERLYARFIELLTKGADSDDPDAHLTDKGSAADGSTAGREGLFRRLARRLRSIFGRGKHDVEPDREDHISQIPAPEEETEPDGRSVPDDGADTSPHRSRKPAGGTMPGQRKGNGRSSPRRTAAPRRLSTDSDDGWRSPKQLDKLPENLKLLREARAIENAMALAVLRRHGEWSTEMANRYFPPADLGFIYRSMWNLRSRYLTTYTSVPICWKNSMEVHHGEDVVPPPRRAGNLFDLDILCLQNTAEVLDRFLKKKRQVLFMAVVHASTLTDKQRLAEYREILEAIPQAACRQLIFEIVDVGDFVHRAEAIQMVRTLLPHARAVTASVGVGDRDFAFWKQCGFMAVGADISREHTTDEEIIGNLAFFAAQSKRHRMLCYLRELDRFSLTLSAAGAGFDFLEGAVIGSSDDPENLVLSKFNIENLYENTPEVVWAD